MRAAALVLAVLAAAALAAFLVASSGWIDVAAREPHPGPIEWLLERTRESSVERRARQLEVPPLGAAAQVARGAALYQELCAGCHGAPGRERSAVGRGLNPPPPDLSAGIAAGEAAEAYWITANGIRMSGMPAFAPTLGEEDLWALVALLVELQEMPPEEYRDLAASGPSP